MRTLLRPDGRLEKRKSRKISKISNTPKGVRTHNKEKRKNKVVEPGAPKSKFCGEWAGGVLGRGSVIMERQAGRSQETFFYEMISLLSYHTK